MCEFDKGTKYKGDYGCGMWPFLRNGSKIASAGLLMSGRSDESTTVSRGDGYWRIDHALYKGSQRVTQKKPSLTSGNRTRNH